MRRKCKTTEFLTVDDQLFFCLHNDNRKPKVLEAEEEPMRGDRTKRGARNYAKWNNTTPANRQTLAADLYVRVFFAVYEVLSRLLKNITEVITFFFVWASRNVMWPPCASSIIRRYIIHYAQNRTLSNNPDPYPM